MSYMSPIKLKTIPEMEEGWTDKVAKYIAGETDKLILESCMKVVCDVDEEELVKALQYDRGQYEKGYADGKRNAAAAIEALQAQLPKRGEWIDGDERRVTARCSICGHLRLGNGAEYANKHVHFCENCGSKMGGQNDEP